MAIRDRVSGWYNARMNSIVALDIETTGLDPEKDFVIEIGMVRFSPRRVEDEWSTLINPGRPIPPFITQLTGITDQMVREAPKIQSVFEQIRDFAGNDPILGHNVRFDLSFLRRHRLLGLNEAIDTYELAAVLLPSAGRYNLAALGQILNIPLPANHRAFDDARVTRGIYQRLFDLALSLTFESPGGDRPDERASGVGRLFGLARGPANQIQRDNVRHSSTPDSPGPVVRRDEAVSLPLATLPSHRPIRRRRSRLNTGIWRDLRQTFSRFRIPASASGNVESGCASFFERPTPAG
jgi:DNA polymerase III epsilon subunit family exonuclease